MTDFFDKLFGKNKNDNSQMEYWYLGGAYQGDKALCSDNQCPCPQVSIPRDQGYIYVVQYPNGNFAANLTCDEGAKLRKLNLAIARKDAQHWWNTGMVPKRATPIDE